MVRLVSAHTLILAFLIGSSTLHAEGVYDRESASQEIDWPYREYALFGSWHTKCSLTFMPPKFKSRTCELRYTDGSKTNSGRYDTFNTGPIVQINALGDRAPYLFIKMGYRYNFKGDYPANFSVGDDIFTHVIPRSASFQGWHNEVAVPVVKSFIRSNTAKYAYQGSQEKISGSISLKGFTAAWNHSVAFTGYNPLEK